MSQNESTFGIQIEQQFLFWFGQLTTVFSKEMDILIFKKIIVTNLDWFELAEWLNYNMFPDFNSKYASFDQANKFCIKLIFKLPVGYNPINKAEKYELG